MVDLGYGDGGLRVWGWWNKVSYGELGYRDGGLRVWGWWNKVSYRDLGYGNMSFVKKLIFFSKILVNFHTRTNEL
jgi:hypothetical protein